jgi:hypothetical protein
MKATKITKKYEMPAFDIEEGLQRVERVIAEMERLDKKLCGEAGMPVEDRTATQKVREIARNAQIVIDQIRAACKTGDKIVIKIER